jgi:hypothetical protein
MKMIVSILALSLSLTCFISCKDSDKTISPDIIYFPDADNVDMDQLPILSFKDTLFEFGTILEGEIIDRVYEFENTGKVPLVLTRVEPSCGCTIAKDWPRDPIAPGESGKISISFDSNQRIGIQNKSITVIANTYPSSTMLYLKGNIIGPQKSK